MSNYKKQDYDKQQKTNKTQSAPLFKKSLLAMCIVALNAPVYAQNTEPPVEEVVVYGIKQSLESAQAIKRNSATVTDVITASDIGALPDKSVVEALQRVPGVAIERFEASDDPDHFSVEGGNVTIRGLNRVRAEFNGRDAFSAGADGGMSFSDIPPELVGSVEVAKNQTADLIEGGIAGTINLNTRKPFDKDGFTAGVTVKGSYGDLIEDVNPSISGIVSNVWDTDLGKVGALFSVSASNFTSRGDGIGIYNYYEKDAPDVGNGVTPIVPNAASARQQFNDRDRLGFAGSLQWANPSDTVLATLEFIRSDSTVAWNERFIESPAQPFTGDAGTDRITLGDDYTFACPASDATPCQFRSGTLLGGTYPWGNVPYVAGARAREDERVINDWSFNLKLSPSDNLTLWADVQYVKAENSIKDNTAHGKFFSDIYLDIRDEDNPKLEFLNDNVANPESYFMRSAMDHISENEGDELALQLDAEYTFDDQWITGVKTGLRFSNREVTVRETIWNWGGLTETWSSQGEGSEAFYDGLLDAGMVEQFTFDSHLSGNALKGNNTFWFPSESFLSSTENMYQKLVANDGRTVDGAWVPLHRRAGVIPGTSFLPSEIYVTEEDRYAAYVRVDFGSEDGALRYSGNVGLRYVTYELASTGASNFPNPVGAELQNPGLDPSLPQDVIDYQTGDGTLATTIRGKKFDKVLPSFNLKVELTDDLLARLAVSEAIYLPELNAVRNQRNISSVMTVLNDPDSNAVTGVIHEGFYANGAGNPYLQPEEAVNVDLALEWYFDDLGSLTLTLFNKDVDGYFRQATETELVTNPENGITQEVSSTRTINGGSAEIRGYELAGQTGLGFIHESLTDFGIQASYTYIDGDADDGSSEFDPTDSPEDTFRNFTGLPLEGLSQDNYNLVVFYDNGTFQTRFAYSWRSRYLLNSRDVIAFSPIYGEATGQLDWSASYSLNDTIKIGLEANNLLDEVTRTSIQYNQEGVRTPRSYFVNDRRVGLFIQATF
ncbi:TonB-dependent receptor [Cellvibrio japonicus]|uniref:TonB-dependent receptor n=1 Tax=Cellvibrio japonicus (strain Ueda107) TaxID=498211 RepID=B3PC68_CELJU|nr:TonB-dependent receptor [Cellvibrio japonicus]ACE84531.1 TonB-dependent receptor [Cellvibrio japonicus Ueda107]QEI13210.1 TonB-dependent receptor [Cellvibrio japonicus]QEI16784.1 TonB-dependent receptor [Cellvibrio japonicus]QEI20362.1 TonB-dependent receptor [Cellvibrio japonicus]